MYLLKSFGALFVSQLEVVVALLKGNVCEALFILKQFRNLQYFWRAQKQIYNFESS